MPIDKPAAIDIAKRVAAERDYPRLEPLSAIERDEDFIVSTNAEELGGNVVVVIDRMTGEVCSAHHYLR